MARAWTKSIYDKLKDHERLGIITFNDYYEDFLPLQNKRHIDQKAFFHELENVKAEGGYSWSGVYPGNPDVANSLKKW